MQLTKQTSLLFVLNLLDALFTVFWVRNGFAEEGNHLMAGLLDMGDMPFLTVKIFGGALAAFVLSRWQHVKIARYGVTLALGVYLGLMAIHFFTGLSAVGIVSDTLIDEFRNLSGSFLASIC